jgi:GntR family transcriptional repressor for pyruvate dehydrogenase complex
MATPRSSFPDFARRRPGRADGATRLSTRRHPAGGGALNRPLKTSETVARDIVHDIVTRGLKTGDRLSSEAAMLEQYGVSRESLREGLRLLEVQGLIAIRRGPGGGPSVGNVDPANLGRISTLFYQLAGGTYAELFDAWVVAESILAERAARNEDRAAVAAAMEPFWTPPPPHQPETDVLDFVQSHTHFHGIVGYFAHNRVLELMLQTVGQIVTHHFIINADPRDVEDEIDRDHAQIARAIAAGRPSSARRLMEAHIQGLVDFCREQMGDQMDDFIEWR